MSTSPRREFLSWLGTSSVLAAATSLFKAEPLAAQGAQGVQPVDSKWDMSWVDRVNGKVKAVFDCPEFSGGAGIFRTCVWRDQYKEVYGTQRTDAAAVFVIRHHAIDLAMNDAYWDRFEIGKREKWKDETTKKWITKNPIRASEAGASGPTSEYNLTDFMAQGGIVLACGMAFGRVVSTFRNADKLSAADANRVAREHLVPGVILQPSGIFAALRAQEAGCSYVLAS